MARQLPFTIDPKPRVQRVGDEETGVLEFRVRKGISLAERLAVREIDQSDVLFEAIGKFCVRVHRDANGEGDVPFNDTPKGEAITARPLLHEIYIAVNGLLDLLSASSRPSLNPLQTEIALRYPEDVAALRQQQDENGERVVVRKATVIIQNRYENAPDGWDDEDTRTVNRMGLIVEIAEIFDKESRGTIDSAEATVERQLEQLKDLLGKLPAEPGARSPSLTGETSIGDADTPTPATTSSRPRGLASSTSTTSLKRRRQPTNPKS